MSKPGEIDLEFAFLHADPSAVHPWGMAQASPLEALMEREEPQEGGHRWGPLFMDLLAFLMADGEPMRPELVMRRAVLVFRTLLPGLAIERGGELTIDHYGGAGTGLFPLAAFRAMVEEQVGWEEALGKLMGHLYPACGKRWLVEGTKRVYVLARTYAYDLVSWRPRLAAQGGLSRDHKREFEAWELTYEAMALAFEEIGEGALETTEAARARSRWSARAVRTVVRPIEEGGGIASLPYGKSSETRERYRAAAKGNSNRVKGGRSAE